MSYEITQESWADALLEAWRHHRSVASAMLDAAHVPIGVRLTKSEWDSLHRQIEGLLPKYNGHFYPAHPVSAFIAKHSSKASECLWNGQFEKARKWMLSGRDFGSASISRAEQRERNAARQQAKTTVFVRKRELDRSHDWHTVK